MISPISKILIFFLISSCSWFSKHQDTKTLVPKNTNRPVFSEYGPTRRSGGWFTNVTEELGLSGVKSVHNYAVDLDNDGATDLVTLASNASEPEFFFWNKKKKKFEKARSRLEDSLYLTTS